MVADKHIVRLAPGALGFFDPINRLHLMYPNRMVGELPLDADLTYIARAVKGGRLIDVSGTVMGGTKTGGEPQNAPPPASAPAPAPVEVQEAVAEPVDETAPAADAPAGEPEDTADSIGNEHDGKKQGKRKR